VTTDNAKRELFLRLALITAIWPPRRVVCGSGKMPI